MNVNPQTEKRRQEDPFDRAGLADIGLLAGSVIAVGRLLLLRIRPRLLPMAIASMIDPDAARSPARASLFSFSHFHGVLYRLLLRAQRRYPWKDRTESQIPSERRRCPSWEPSIRTLLISAKVVNRQHNGLFYDYRGLPLVARVSIVRRRPIRNLRMV